MALTFLNEGDITHIQGSGKKPYEVKKVGGVVSCSCPAWRNLGGPIDTRVCKHIKANIDPTCLLPQALSTISPAPVATPGQVVAAPVATPKLATKAEKRPPPVLLAHLRTDEDPTGWWMSEKLDGVRAWWTGEEFLSRDGNVYHAPEWFKAHLLKNVVLDGELWMGRKMFQKASGAVRKLIGDDDEWLKMECVIFDAPEHGGTFEERYKWLTSNPALSMASGVRVLQQVKCKSPAHMEEFYQQILAAGGEGIMLRKSGSLYESGKSTTCLKVKPFFDDECVVTGYTKGKGKHVGRIGALECTWKGVEFEVGGGLTDKQRESPPAIGAKITFRYTELTDAGVPRFPRFVAVRDYE